MLFEEKKREICWKRRETYAKKKSNQNVDEVEKVRDDIIILIVWEDMD